VAQKLTLSTQPSYRWIRHFDTDTCSGVSLSLLNVCSVVDCDHLVLVEICQDADELPMKRLRSLGLNVVDRPAPRLRTDVRTNHVGIIVVADPHANLVDC
jgi:hypothetical protein